MILVQFLRMKTYELTIVVPGKITPAKKKSTIGTVEKIIKIVDGKIEKVHDLGEIVLSYPILKNTSGVFVRFDLELSEASARPIKEKLVLEGGVIRFLLVRKEK